MVLNGVYNCTNYGSILDKLYLILLLSNRGLSS